MRMNRRHFCGAAAAAAVSVLQAAPDSARKIKVPRITSTVNGVILGCNTYSFIDRPLDEALSLIAEIGYGEVEIHPRHIEPTYGAPGADGQPRREASLTSEEREKLRQWRL